MNIKIYGFFKIVKETFGAVLVITLMTSRGLNVFNPNYFSPHKQDNLLNHSMALFLCQIVLISLP